MRCQVSEACERTGRRLTLDRGAWEAGGVVSPRLRGDVLRVQREDGCVGRCCMNHTCLLVLYICCGLLDEDIFQGKELVDSHPLQALVAGLKACSTWENIRCLQGGHECTGGVVSPRGTLPAGPCVTARVGEHLVPTGGAQRPQRPVALGVSINFVYLF